MTKRRTDFGSIRRLPSGRWQVRYRDPAGVMRPGPNTFRTKTEASRYLASVYVDMQRGQWVDPVVGRIILKEYAPSWLQRRRVRGAQLAPRTIGLYGWLLDTHILPQLGTVQLRRLTTRQIAVWYEALRSEDGPGDITAAKCYRLLRAICNTAVLEGELVRNPCTLPGAGQESSPARPVISIADTYKLAEAVGRRWRTLVLLAGFGGLRFGELAALTRSSLDLTAGTVNVHRSVAELPGGVRHVGPPKSRAGRRTVALPPHLLPDLRVHLAKFAAPGEAGLVFVGPLGGPLRGANFGRDIWRPAVKLVGLEGAHFHDLRATAATVAALSGATTAELMRRLGHATADVALRYQRATAERDAAVAERVSDLVRDKIGDLPLADDEDEASAAGG